MITMRRAQTLLEVAEREKRDECERRLADWQIRRDGHLVAGILAVTALAGAVLVWVVG